MAISLYLTHPEVEINPNIATPRWGLSDIGRNRILSAIGHGIFSQIETIIASSEQKSIDTATMIAKELSLEVISDAQTDENDRSSTGFLPMQEFEKTADKFFDQPDVSVQGWETASSAQNRIVTAIAKNLANQPNKRVLFVGHGAVGTLLKCHLDQRRISRDEDQRRLAAKGGGNIFAFEWTSRTLRTDWVSMEDWPA